MCQVAAQEHSHRSWDQPDHLFNCPLQATFRVISGVADMNVAELNQNGHLLWF